MNLLTYSGILPKLLCLQLMIHAGHCIVKIYPQVLELMMKDAT